MDFSSIALECSTCFRRRPAAPGAGPQEIFVCIDDAGEEVYEQALLSRGQAGEHSRL